MHADRMALTHLIVPSTPSTHIPPRSTSLSLFSPQSRGERISLVRARVAIHRSFTLTLSLFASLLVISCFLLLSLMLMLVLVCSINSCIFFLQGTRHHRATDRTYRRGDCGCHGPRPGHDRLGGGLQEIAGLRWRAGSRLIDDFFPPPSTISLFPVFHFPYSTFFFPVFISVPTLLPLDLRVLTRAGSSSLHHDVQMESWSMDGMHP